MAFYTVLMAWMHGMDIYPRRWTESLPMELYMNTPAFTESRSHFIKNSGTYFTIFETTLCFQSVLIHLFTEVIRDLHTT